MRRKYLFSGIGIASFALFTIAYIPASTLTNQLNERVSERMPGNIRIGGVEGTLWNGYIHSLDINGWQLRDTSWNLNPAALLLGRLSASIVTSIADSEITANASISMSGAISVRNLEAAGPIFPIAALFNLPVTGGRYQVQLSALDITDAWPTSLVGSGRVTGVPLNFRGDTSGPTGNYAVVFNAETVPEDGQLSGTLSDDGGPVEIGGKIVLTPPMNYELQAKVKARPGAPAEITQALTFAGAVGPDGRREISMAGSL
jgi:hypothetical protein